MKPAKLKTGDMFSCAEGLRVSYWIVVPKPPKGPLWCHLALRLPGGHKEPAPYLPVGSQSWWSSETKVKRLAASTYAKLVKDEGST